MTIVAEAGPAAQEATRNALRIAVGDRYMKGAESLAQGANLPEFQMVIFQQAFHETWNYDAHFVTYDVRGTEEGFPRLRKNCAVVDELRAMGLDVVQTMFAFDYDNPEHAAWTPEGLVTFKQRVEDAVLVNPLMGAWRIFYTTKHGARFVYLLAEPVPVGPESEAMHRSLLRAWGQRGITLDPACSDWTRMFRLPNVVREK